MKKIPIQDRGKELVDLSPDEYQSFPKSTSPILIKWFWACIGTYIAILPFYHTTALRNTAFVGLILCTLILQVQSRRQWQFPIWFAWLPYFIVAIGSLTYALDPISSLREIKTEIIYPFLVLSITATWIRSVQSIDRLIWVAVAINACLVCSSLAIWLSTAKHEITLIGAFNIRSGTYSTYLITIIPFIVALAWRQWHEMNRGQFMFLVLLLALNIFAVYATRNRQSFLTLLAECSILGLIVIRQHFTWRRIIALAFTLFVGMILFKAQFESRVGDWKIATVNDVRWALWDFSIKKIMATPLSGAGFGREAFALAFPEISRSNSSLWHTHNMILNKGIQMGLPGIAAFFLLLFSTAKRLAKGLRPHQSLYPYAVAALAMLTGIIVKNMTDDFFVRDGALLFWLLAGAVMGVIYHRERPPADAIS